MAVQQLPAEKAAILNPTYQSAYSHSFRVRVKQLPYPKSGLRVRKSEKNYKNYEKIAQFLNLTQLTHLRLADLS